MTELRKIPKSKDFNPRLREGGDAAGAIEQKETAPISIHASAKEATTVAGVPKVAVTISIHASAKEATI